jgi:O-antigen/teichoic acid export membrane protein
VPILVVQSVYAVAVPACVVERTGPIKALSRSEFLTKNNRWRIVGFTVALALCASIPVLIIAYLGGRTGHPIIATAVRLPVAGIANGFGAVAVAVLYAQLRLAREGADIEHIVQVFD